MPPLSPAVVPAHALVSFGYFLDTPHAGPPARDVGPR